MISMNKDLSSLIDGMVLEGIFGVDRYADCSIHWVSGKVERPVEDNNRHIIHQTRRIFVYWYQMSYPGPAILGYMALEVRLEGIAATIACIEFGGKVKKPLERYNLLKTQDCWLRITHVIPMNKYLSSLLDDLALEVPHGCIKQSSRGAVGRASTGAIKREAPGRNCKHCT
jgi:hypothetical protein